MEVKEQSGLTDCDLARIKRMLFDRTTQFLNTHGFTGNQATDEVIQREYDSLCAKAHNWYQRAWTRIGKRINAHFITAMAGEPRKSRLVVFIFPYEFFLTREDAKNHPGYMDEKCSDALLEDHGDSGLVVIHNGQPPQSL